MIELKPGQMWRFKETVRLYEIVSIGKNYIDMIGPRHGADFCMTKTETFREHFEYYGYFKTDYVLKMGEVND